MKFLYAQTSSEEAERRVPRSLRTCVHCDEAVALELEEAKRLCASWWGGGGTGAWGGQADYAWPSSEAERREVRNLKKRPSSEVERWWRAVGGEVERFGGKNTQGACEGVYIVLQNINNGSSWELFMIKIISSGSQVKPLLIFLAHGSSCEQLLMRILSVVVHN
jgi:hypothetical protein